MIAEISAEIHNLKVSKKNLRKFGILLFFVFAIITGLMLWRSRPYWTIPAVISLLFLFAGLAIPVLLRGFYRVWMAIGFILGWIMTRLILTVAFFLIFTPIGLLLRIIKKDLLDMKIEKTEKSYWKKHEAVTDKSRHLKQF